MIKRLIAAALCLIFTLLCLVACGDESSVLFVPVDAPADVFDPQIVFDPSEITIVRNCFEGLVRRGADGEILPGVAESWSLSPDGLTLTFRLRDDAKWHLTSNAADELEGKLPEGFDLSVTAFDFEFALKRAADPNTGCPESYMLLGVKNAADIAAGEMPASALGVRATDRRTLVVDFELPQGNFLDILTEPMCMPCSETFFRACSGRYGRYIKYLLSNGPYYLSRFNETENTYRINKNPDYAGGDEAGSDAVWLYYDADRAGVTGKLKDGDYSCAVLTQYEYENAKISRRMNVTPTANVLRAFVMNLSDPALSNENIRKALSGATDNAAAAQNAGRAPAEGIVPAAAAAEGVTGHPVAFDETAAKTYYAAGLRELEQTGLSVAILCEPEYEDMTRRLVQQWQRILGVSLEITISSCSAPELENAVRTGNYQIALASVRAETDKVYEYFSSFAPGSPYNTTGYSDEGLGGYLCRLYSGSDGDFASAYRLLESRLIRASFMIPLWNESSYFVSNVSSDRIDFFTGRDKLYF